MVGILLYEFFAAVGAAAVNHNPFKVLERLRDNAVDGLLQAVAIVEVDGDYG